MLVYQRVCYSYVSLPEDILYIYIYTYDGFPYIDHPVQPWNIIQELTSEKYSMAVVFLGPN
jgi:hypothetical protein